MYAMHKGKATAGRTHPPIALNWLFVNDNT